MYKPGDAVICIDDDLGTHKPGEVFVVRGVRRGILGEWVLDLSGETNGLYVTEVIPANTLAKVLWRKEIFRNV